MNLPRQLVISARELVIGYASKGRKERKIAGPLTLEISAGKLIFLLGANGSGKSTLIKTLAGILPALSGEVFMGTDLVSKLKPSAIATRLSLVLTDKVKTGNMKVFSLVALGRYPYTGWLGTLNALDHQKINAAIESVHLENFLERNMDELSDGEHQKVMLARALAQDTALIILDEPTAHLDLQNRVELIRLLHKLSRESGKSILLSTHELDLALQTADEIWLMDGNGNLVSGTPEDLILNGKFEQAVDKNGDLFDKNTGLFTVRQHEGPFVKLSGEGLAAFWTGRALHRLGFQTGPEPGPEIEIEVYTSEHRLCWTLKSQAHTRQCFSLKELTDSLHQLTMHKNIKP